MAEENRLIVGMDLSNDCIQASYLIDGMKEPESVILGFASQTYHIRTEGYKKKGENKWAFGDTGKKYFEDGEYLKIDNIMEKVAEGEPVEIDGEQYMPADLLECLFRFVLRESVRVTDIEKVSKVAVCVDRFGKKLLDSICSVLERMSFEKEDILLLNRTESFVYYALSAGEELYKRGVGLCDFDGTKLNYSYMNYANLENKTIVMVDTQKAKVTASGEKAVDAELAGIAARLMNNMAMSSVYLTGDGFETYEHLDEFVKAACNRKRAFIGQNLYAKGAAWGAFEYFYGGNFKNRVLACEDRILADFDIDIVEREKPKIYRAVRVGTNWYMAGRKLRFIVNDAKEITIHVKPIEKKPDQDIVISLDEFPKRPDRMTKLMMEIDFSSASQCRLSLKDMGFGDFYKSTDKIVYRDIKL
ncbi:MAG: DUF5716 family protein [Thermoflexaceae bacterium]|nr:DUF5716 family protein [Thermoflexaceae bacterium]